MPAKRTFAMVSSVCLLMAAKFFDRKLPPLSELVKVLKRDKVTKEELAQTELDVLQLLGWNLNAFTPHHFIEEAASLCGNYKMEGIVKESTLFFVDLSPYCYKALKFHPSMIACASMMIAWSSKGEPENVDKYTDTLAMACKVKDTELKEAVTVLREYYFEMFPEQAD